MKQATGLQAQGNFTDVILFRPFVIYEYMSLYLFFCPSFRLRILEITKYVAIYKQTLFKIE